MECQPAGGQVSVPVGLWIGVALYLRLPGTHGALTQKAPSPGDVHIDGL